MSKAILKYYFFTISLLAIVLIFIFDMLNGFYVSDRPYIYATIIPTSVVYASLLNKETLGQTISKEIGITFLAFITLWFFLLFVLILWKTTDLSPNSFDGDDFIYYLVGLEAFRALVLSTMMPKIFPNR